MGGLFLVQAMFEAQSKVRKTMLGRNGIFMAILWRPKRSFNEAKNIYLVSLDITNQVPFETGDLKVLDSNSKYGSIVNKILSECEHWIQEGGYYAWDPLAATLLVQPDYSLLLQTKDFGIFEQKP